jgi:hypothetical protein
MVLVPTTPEVVGSTLLEETKVVLVELGDRLQNPLQAVNTILRRS